MNDGPPPPSSGDDPGPSSIDTVDRWSTRVTAVVLVILFVVLGLIVLGESTRPVSERFVLGFGWWAFELKWFDWPHMREGGAVLAGCVAVLLVAERFLSSMSQRASRTRAVARLFAPLAAVCVLLSGSLSVGGLATIRPQFFDVRDQSLYLLGTRYFDETGYTLLNHCIVEAAHESGLRVPSTIRDLRTNKRVETAPVLEKKRCRGRFSDARWQAFLGDIKPFYEGMSGWGNSWEAILNDHGFNGTPVLRRLIATTTSFVDASHASLTRLAFWNLAAVFAAFFVVLFWVGWRETVVLAIVLFVYPGDGFLHVASIPRYFWLASLVVGVAALHRGRFALGGAALTFSASLKVFPVLWLAGPAVLFAVALLQRRVHWPWLVHATSPSWSSMKRFAIAGAATGAVLFVWSILDTHGLASWSEFFRQMGLKGTRLAAGCIGFQYDFLRPIVEREGGWEPALRRLHAPIVLGVSLFHVQRLLQIALAVVVLRRCARLPADQSAMLGGFALLFLFLGPVRYYYAGFLGLPLLFLHRRSPLLFTISSVGLLLLAAVAGWRFEHVFEAHIYNGFLSVGFTVFLIAALIAFEFEERAARRRDNPASQKREPETAKSGDVTVPI